jgi:cysteine synthase
MDRPGGLSAIGDTPVVRLARMAGDGGAEVWVKMEAANPTGSYKDRMALAMIEAAEVDGRLRPGQLVVEYTGGSTGSSLAFVCAVKGYPLRIVSSDAFADEKIRTMRAFGAEVELIPSRERSRRPARPPATKASSPDPPPGRTSPPHWTSQAGSALATAWSPCRSTAA